MSRLRIRSSYLSSAAGFVLGLPSGLKRDGRLFFLSLFQHFLSAVPFFCHVGSLRGVAHASLVTALQASWQTGEVRRAGLLCFPIFRLPVLYPLHDFGWRLVVHELVFHEVHVRGYVCEEAVVACAKVVVAFLSVCR